VTAPARAAVLPGRLPVAEWWPAAEPHARVRFVPTAAGDTVRVVEMGGLDAPPVLCLHGWGCSAYLWRKNLPALAAAGFRAIAPDLRGHGQSSVPLTPGAYTLDAFVASTVALLDALALDRVALLGQSLGGGVALGVARTAPARLTHLGLVSPVGIGQVHRAADLRHYVPLAAGRVIPRFAMRWGSWFVLKRTYGRLGRFTARDVDEYWAPTQFPEHARAMVQLLREFDFAQRPVAECAALALPLLVLWGTVDRTVYPRGAAERVAAAGGRLVTIRGGGHALNEEVPDIANPLLVEFLSASA
jgi:pyruvate dehydrogenase E2 component (dihydrolipoamide acetyltransferase)